MRQIIVCNFSFLPMIFCWSLTAVDPSEMKLLLPFHPCLVNLLIMKRFNYYFHETIVLSIVNGSNIVQFEILLTEI